MQKNFFLVSLIFLSTFQFNSFASSFFQGDVDFNQNPPHIQWKKINTDHFEIIFPKEISREGKRVAFLLEKVYKVVSRSLEVYPEKISLILQNQSVQSNGFVTLAPRRSEWYVTPTVEADLSNTEWLKTLAIHEFRHVVQFQKSRQRFNRVFEFFLGEIGQALGLAFTLPPWFLEGDAVGMETALTQGGRGRLPLFERDLRTLLVSGEKYDTDKALLRSFDDWVPNHYVYGYFLTTYLRNTYGDLVLSKLANHSSNNSWNPLSFYNSADDFTFGEFEEFYQNTMKDLLRHWIDQSKKIKPTPVKIKNASKPYGWTNYSSPMITTDGNIIALKSGMSFINHFVLIKNKTEEILFYPGPIFQEYPLKIRKDRFAYLEYELDPRWGYQDFQKLVVYDVKTRTIHFELPRTKLRLAVLNHEGTQIAAVEWNENQNQKVVVIDLSTGKRQETDVSDNKIITSLDWKGHDKFVAVIKDENDLKSVIEIDRESGKSLPLTQEGTTNLGFLTVHDEEVFVESPESGIDNIFHLNQGSLEQLTISKFGAYSPVLFKDKLYYSDYSLNGLNIVEKSLPWREKQKSENQFYPIYEKISFFEKSELQFTPSDDETKNFKVEDYFQVKNSFNFHSWLLLIPPLSSTITLTHLSQDILNKFQFSYGAQYNLNEYTLSGFTSASWSNYYPVFDLTASYGNRRQVVSLINEDIKDTWEEGKIEFGFSLPHKKIVNEFNQNFLLRFFTNVIHVTDKYFVGPSDLTSTDLFSKGVSANLSLLQRTALRDLYPPFGTDLNVSYEEGKNIKGFETSGSLWHTSLLTYFPGFGKHHSFFYQAAYEKQVDREYRYASEILAPRGTTSIFFNDLFKYSFNYSFPLAYPDWSLYRYYFLKRIYTNLFYDRAAGSSPEINHTVSSTGMELIFNSHFFRLMLPINLGLRGVYLLTGPNKETMNYEFFVTSTLAVF